MLALDDFVGVILFIWFFLAFVAILAISLDQFLVYHTTRFFNTYITNIYILILTISLTIFFQVLFVDLFFQYRTHFNTEYAIVSQLQKQITS